MFVVKLALLSLSVHGSQLGCPNGYEATANPFQCQPCSPGYFTNSNVLWGLFAGGCAPCSPGTYASGYASSDCTPCGDNAYSSGGATFCSGCPIGHSCKGGILKACGPGMMSKDDGSCGCLDNYGPNDDFSACVPCPANFWSNGGFKDISVFNNPKVSGCSSCTNGQWSVSGQGCQVCPAGQTSGAGQSCVDCNPGSYQISVNDVNGLHNICQACPSGTFSAVSGASSSTVCQTCPMGSIAPSVNNMYCQGCDTGKTSNANFTQCVSCPENQYVNATTNQVCQFCPDGYTPSSTRNSCVPCALGTFSTAATNHMCFACPDGVRSINGVCTGTCSAPNYYTYKDGQTCGLCPNGIPNVAGGCACPVNHFWDSTWTNATDSSKACVLCPLGSYSTYGTIDSCVTCSPGQYWTGYECQGCASRVGLINSHEKDCKVCPAGTYSSGSISCLACPLGQYQPTPGSSSCITALPGQYVNPVDNSTFKQCPQNTFSNSPGSWSCKSCDMTSTTGNAGDGSATCSCAPGYTLFNPLLGTCDPCPLGMFSEGGISLCVAAKPGQFVDPKNASQATPCAIGSFSLAQSSQCTICDTNSTISSDIGGTTCLCKAGYVHFNIATGSCSPCRPGNWGTLGMTNCTSALPGQWVSPSDPSTVYNCGAFPPNSLTGNYSAGVRASACSVCDLVSTIGPNLSSLATGCNCQYGFAGFNSTTGKCSQCNPGSVSIGNATVNCSVCDPGKASYLGRSCVDCPAGLYASQGSSVCSSTGPGEFTPSAGKSRAYTCDPVSTIVPASSNNTFCLCQPGYANFQTNDTTFTGFCSKCLSTQVSAGGLVQECSNCDDGKYANSSLCSPCPLGKYCKGGLIKTCDFASTNGNSPDGIKCSCTTGYNGWNSTTEKCSACLFGWVSQGDAVCSQCQAGQYYDAHNVATCSLCPPGTAFNGIGATTKDACLPCSNGTYNPSSGASTCLSCANQVLSNGTQCGTPIPVTSSSSSSSSSTSSTSSTATDIPVTSTSSSSSSSSSTATDAPVNPTSSSTSSSDTRTLSSSVTTTTSSSDTTSSTDIPVSTSSTTTTLPNLGSGSIGLTPSMVTLILLMVSLLLAL